MSPDRSRFQTTLAAPAELSGLGVHSGAPVLAVLTPAAPGTGRVFVRLDAPAGQGEIPALRAHVVDTRNNTTLANAHGWKIATGEHVLAALAGLGVDNVRIGIDGPEAPILDGSAAPACAAILAAGLAVSEVPQPMIRVLREVAVGDGRREAKLRPCRCARFAARIRFDHPAIGRQAAAINLTPARFAAEIAPARTFGFLKDLDALHAAGLARGASLANTVAFDAAGLANPEGLRFANEPARHKLLDAIGDLALAGAPILGAYTAIEPGHAVNAALLAALFDAPDAWEWTA